MHSLLDSRFLNLTNCFSYRFASVGAFRYSLSPLPIPLGKDETDDDEGTHRIEVVDDEGREQQQHQVIVTRVGGELIGQPTKLTINRGDIVTWSTDGSPGLSFAVRGAIGDATIDSAAMEDDSVFTHAFGMPGEYVWADANGGPLKGVVRVVQPQLEGQEAAGRRLQWQRALTEGTMVHIVGDRATPDEVEIMVGQTVFWAVERAPGISITDVTLLS